MAAFLRTEIASERFGREIVALLERDGRDRSLIDEPDTRNVEENCYRLQLFSDFRGYKQNRGLFEGFPGNVSWYRAILTREELAGVRYIDYSYWNELSGGSRLPADAAKNIREGVEVFEVSNDGFFRMAEALRKGALFPELILVGTAPGSELVVLEGHVRLTAYSLVYHH
ncbi:MAG: hypothetical protein KY468_10245 [Armatimonadetes bacterium]|nr:hypothetical protein [Armatimonadota bacterium]